MDRAGSGAPEARIPFSSQNLLILLTGNFAVSFPSCPVPYRIELIPAWKVEGCVPLREKPLRFAGELPSFLPGCIHYLAF